MINQPRVFCTLALLHLKVLLSLHFLPFFSAFYRSKRQKSFFLFLSLLMSSHVVSVPVHPPKPPLKTIVGTPALVPRQHLRYQEPASLKSIKRVDSHLMLVYEAHRVSLESLSPWFGCHIGGGTFVESFPETWQGSSIESNGMVWKGMIA